MRYKILSPYSTRRQESYQPSCFLSKSNRQETRIKNETDVTSLIRVIIQTKLGAILELYVPCQFSGTVLVSSYRVNLNNVEYMICLSFDYKVNIRYIFILLSYYVDSFSWHVLCCRQNKRIPHIKSTCEYVELIAKFTLLIGSRTVFLRRKRRSVRHKHLSELELSWRLSLNSLGLSTEVG